MRSVLAALPLLLAAACSEPAPRTQVMLVIDAEPAVETRVTTLHVQIFGGPEGGRDSTFASRFDRAFDDPAWPRRVALVPIESESARAWRAEIAGLDESGAPVVTTTVRGGYASDRTVRLDVILEEACAAVDCDDGLRCTGGSCVDSLLDVSGAPDLELDAGS